MAQICPRPGFFVANCGKSMANKIPRGLRQPQSSRGRGPRKLKEVGLESLMDSNNKRQTWSPTVGLWLTIAASAGVVLCARIFGPDDFYVSEREWQTALTSWWMVAEGYGLFDAITPLLGPPWQIPMEFPLFQWLTAHATTPWLSLEDTGRTLSFLYFLISVYLVRRLALDLDLNRSAADSAAILFASSPLFLCYAFSFTIESLGLMLALIYLWLFVRWLLQPGLVLLMATILAGSVAALTTPATWIVFGSAVSAMGAWSILSARRHGRSTGDALVGLVLSVGIPLAGTSWWVRWSDTIKAANGLTADLTSGALIQWTLGSLEQRLSPAQWGIYCLQTTLLVLGPVGLAVAGPAVLSFFRSRRVRAPLPVLAASVTALITGPMVFTNLYFRHDYYSMAIGIFAIVLLTSTLFTQKPRRWLVAMIVVSNLATTGLFLAGKQANYADPLSDSLGRFVTLVPQDHTIIVVGSFLDARVPYQAQRKALQTKRYDPSDPALRDGIASMKKQKVSAILCRSAKGVPAASMAANTLGLRSRIDISPGVSIWTTPALKSKATTDPLDLESEVSRRMVGFSEEDQPGKWGLLFPSGPDAQLGIGVKFRENLYLVDIERGIRVVHHRWSPEGRGD